MPDPATHPPRLPYRPLARAGRSISPLIWELRAEDLRDPGRECVLDAALAAGGACLLPAGLGEGDVARFATLRQRWTTAPVQVLAGVAVDQLLARDDTPLRARLAALAPSDAVVLADADPLDLKGGRPYQRLARLRDAGLTRMIVLDAATAADAEWLIENTAAHGVVLPFGLADPLPMHATLATAAEVGTGAFARLPAAVAWRPPRTWAVEEDVAFVLSDPRVAALVEPLPLDTGAVERLRAAASRPMSETDREAWWSAYQQQVSAPERSRTGHPPEYGA